MKVLHASALSAILFITAACAHEPAIQEIPATAIPSDEIARLEQELNQATAEQVDVLAPKNFAEADKALRDAKDDVKTQDAKDTLREVAVGRAYLVKAKEFAQISTTQMGEVVQARKLALTAGAKDAFGSDFRAADDSLKTVTKDVEDNKVDSAAKKRTELLASYLDLEVRAIRRTALNEAEGRINKAKKEGAEAWAPQSLAQAEKSVKDADNFIIANRHDTAGIKALSDKALVDTDKLLVINKEAHNGTQKTGEQAALKLYAEREKVAVQAADLAVAQGQLNQAQAQKNASAAALASDQAFNKKFEAAQAMFNKSEAEVYRQGDNLVIRLKGLEFNNATATLKGSNFPLLAKVQNVIAELNPSTVNVEGHTDSVGSKAKNEQLSEARAAAVKSYFESNAKQASTSRYVATGYGFQKPIASNKTPAGRAQNRRVDVVLHTEQPAG